MSESDLRAPSGAVPSARSRIDLLLDDGSFTPLGGVDGVITGFGTVDERPVCVFSQDVSGFLDQPVGKATEIFDLALATGCPIVGLYEGDAPPAWHATIIRRSTRASGVVPQLSLIMGTVGGSVHAAVVSDFVIMVDEVSQLLLGEPDVIRVVTGADVTTEELGGARTHAIGSGIAHYLGGDEQDAITYARALLSFLPQNNLDDPPLREPATDLTVEEDHALDTLVPDSLQQPYDVREVITAVLDAGDFLEVHELYAPSVVVGFGRLDGRSVGVLANQSLQLAGHLDSDAVEKAARFVRTCDAYNLALVTFVDVPGFLPSVEQELDGGSRRAAKLAYAYAEATVPLVTVIIGRAYGGAAEVMGSKQLGADACFAWPTARVAPTGPHRAVTTAHRQELADAHDPDGLRARLLAEYSDRVGPDLLGSSDGLDAVIMPHETRTKIIQTLRLLRTKRAAPPPKKHGNIPL